MIAPAFGAAATAQYLYASRSPLMMEEERKSKVSWGKRGLKFRFLHAETNSLLWPNPQLSIYSSPPEPVILAEVRGPLEDQVASGRVYLSEATKTARDALRGQVDRWIGVEKAVESESVHENF